MTNIVYRPEICDLVWTLDGVGLIIDLWFARYVGERMALILLWDGSIKSFTNKEIVSIELLTKFEELN